MAENECTAKIELLRVGGTAAYKNAIFYTHTQQFAFNWRGYDNISDILIQKIKSEIKLPEGVTIK